MSDAATDEAAAPSPRAPSNETPRAEASAAPPRVRGTPVIRALSLGVIAFSLLQILTYGYGRDQAIYAVTARTVLEGGMPYRDAFDFKPPGIFVIFALARALFGPEQWGIRILEVAGLAGMCLAMVPLAERLFGDRRIGVVAAALAVLVHAQLDFWHTAQPESFGGMLTVFALLLATPRRRAGEGRAGEGHAGEGRPEPGALALIASGVLFGAAGLLKPPLAGGGVVVAAALSAPPLVELARRRAQRNADRPAPGPQGARTADAALLRAALRPIALVALGGVLPVLVCLAWFAAEGALGDLWEVLFVFTPHYTALGWRDGNVLGQAWHGVSDWLFRYSGPCALGLACLLALRPERHERAGVALLAGVIAVHLAGVVMQAKFFPYHYGATWPLTAMLASLGLWKAWARCVARGALASAALAAALAVAGFAVSATKDVPGSYLQRSAERIAIVAAGARDPDRLDRLDHLASVADVNAAANRAVAEFLREHVAPGRPVFVWGFEPVMYDLADRPLATRYLYNVPQRAAWARQASRDALMRDLSARPPAAIVVARHDVFPMVTGDAIDSRDTLNGFPALAELIAERYARAVQIEDFEVYLER